MLILGKTTCSADLGFATAEQMKASHDQEGWGGNVNRRKNEPYKCKHFSVLSITLVEVNSSRKHSPDTAREKVFHVNF